MTNRRQRQRQERKQREWIEAALAFGLLATSFAPAAASGYGALADLGANAFASASSVATAGLTQLANAPRDFRINTIDGNPFLPKRSGVNVVLDDSNAGGELSLDYDANTQQKQQLNSLVGGILENVGNFAAASVNGNPYYDANIFLAPLRAKQPSNAGDEGNYGAAAKPTYAQVAHPNYGQTAQQPSQGYIPPSCQSGNCNSASPSPSACIGSNCPQPNHRDLPQYPTRKVLPADSPFAPKPGAVYPSVNGCIGSNCPAQAGQAPAVSQTSFAGPAPSAGQQPYANPAPSNAQSDQDNYVFVPEGPSAFASSPSQSPPPSASTATQQQQIEERPPVATCIGGNCLEPSRTYIPPLANEGLEQPQQVPQPNRAYVPPPTNQGLNPAPAAACSSNNCDQPQAAAWHPAMNPNGAAGGAWHPGVNPGSGSDVKVVYVEYPGEGETAGKPAAADGRVKLTESLQPVPSWLVNGGVGGVLAGDLALGTGNSANAWTAAQANAHTAAASAALPTTANGAKKTSSSSSSSSYAYANSHAYAWSHTYST